jgi:hypothetical protein
MTGTSLRRLCRRWIGPHRGLVKRTDAHRHPDAGRRRSRLPCHPGPRARCDSPQGARPARFLQRYQMVEFQGLDDGQAFKRLLAGILGIPPIQLAGYIQTETDKEHLPPPPSGTFQQGYALVIGIANYP